MRNLHILLFVFLISVGIISCLGPGKEKSKSKSNMDDNSIIADANFPVKKLHNPLYLYRDFKFNKKNMLYPDTLYKIAFIALTEQQKSKLIVTSLCKELRIKDSAYIKKYMTAYFISKPDRIGKFQPIIILIGGDDYNSLKMILLDNKNNPMHIINLAGGFDSGPSYIGDSLMVYESNSGYYLNKNIVTTYRVKRLDFADSLKKPSIIDSTVFKSVIDKNGNIATKQTLKKQYTIPYKKSKSLRSFETS